MSPDETLNPTPAVPKPHLPPFRVNANAEPPPPESGFLPLLEYFFQGGAAQPCEPSGLGGRPASRGARHRRRCGQHSNCFRPAERNPATWLRYHGPTVGRQTALCSPHDLAQRLTRDQFNSDASGPVRERDIEFCPHLPPQSHDVRPTPSPPRNWPILLAIPA